MKTLPALDARGSLNFTPTDPPRPAGRYVFQHVRAGLGNVVDDPSRTLQLRVWVLPFDPMTAPQLARREWFAYAVAAWQSMPQAEKDQWKVKGEKRRLPAYNAFLSWYLPQF